MSYIIKPHIMKSMEDNLREHEQLREENAKLRKLLIFATRYMRELEEIIFPGEIKRRTK